MDASKWPPVSRNSGDTFASTITDGLVLLSRSEQFYFINSQFARFVLKTALYISDT